MSGGVKLEVKVAEVVDTKLQLKALAGELAGRRHHAGVVEQQIGRAIFQNLSRPIRHSGIVGNIERREAVRAGKFLLKSGDGG